MNAIHPPSVTEGTQYLKIILCCVSHYTASDTHNTELNSSSARKVLENRK